MFPTLHYILKYTMSKGEKLHWVSKACQAGVVVIVFMILGLSKPAWAFCKDTEVKRHMKEWISCVQTVFVDRSTVYTTYFPCVRRCSPDRLAAVSEPSMCCCPSVSLSKTLAIFISAFIPQSYCPCLTLSQQTWCQVALTLSDVDTVIRPTLSLLI